MAHHSPTHTILLFTLLLSAALPMSAQNKGDKGDNAGQTPFKRSALVKEVRADNKAEQYAKTAAALAKAFATYPEAATDAQLRSLAVEAENELVKAENKKIYLKSSPDTASYFNHVLQLHQQALICDSLDRLPNEKGRVRPRHTSLLAERTSALRNNLRSGGKYFYKHGKYADALPYFDIYLRTLHHPMRAAEPRSLRPTVPPLDADSVQIATLAALSANAAKNYPAVVRYAPLARRDTTKRAALLEIEAKAYAQLGDTARYIAALDSGITSYPRVSFFYSTLIRHCNDAGLYHRSLQVVDYALTADTLNRTLWFLKGHICLFLHQADEAIDAYRHAVSLQPNDAESYASMGAIYLTRAHNYYAATPLKIGSPDYAANRARLNGFYRQAQHNYEKAQQYAADKPELWLEPLREIYYKLNLGKQLKALEKLAKQTQAASKNQ